MPRYDDRLYAIDWSLVSDAVKADVDAYQREFNELQKHRFAASNAVKDDLTATSKKLNGLYYAVVDGMRSEGIMARISELEARIKELEAAQARQVDPTPVLMHPNLADAYHRKLGKLTEMLNDPVFASEAIPLIRELIDRVDLRHTPEGWEAYDTVSWLLCSMSHYPTKNRPSLLRMSLVLLVR